MKLALTILSLFFVGTYQENKTSCVPEYCHLLGVFCSTITNAPPCAEGEVLVPKGTSCRCCDVCLPARREGEECHFDFDASGIGVPRPCAQGLVCSQDTSKCVAPGS